MLQGSASSSPSSSSASYQTGVFTTRTNIAHKKFVKKNDAHKHSFKVLLCTGEETTSALRWKCGAGSVKGHGFSSSTNVKSEIRGSEEFQEWSPRVENCPTCRSNHIWTIQGGNLNFTNLTEVFIIKSVNKKKSVSKIKLTKTRRIDQRLQLWLAAENALSLLSIEQLHVTLSDFGLTCSEVFLTLSFSNHVMSPHLWRDACSSQVAKQTSPNRKSEARFRFWWGILHFQTPSSNVGAGGAVTVVRRFYSCFCSSEPTGWGAAPGSVWAFSAAPPQSSWWRRSGRWRWRSRSVRASCERWGRWP